MGSSYLARHLRLVAGKWPFKGPTAFLEGKVVGPFALRACNRFCRGYPRQGGEIGKCDELHVAGFRQNVAFLL